MKHVGSAARPAFRVLVTGFGAFPGVPINPTVAILDWLELSRSDLAVRGIDLHLAVLPVVYAEIAGTLNRLASQHRPEAILHLGLASRRSSISVETRAVNRAHSSRPDASGRTPESPTLDGGGPASLTATFPAADILHAIRETGTPARRSVSAGDYVCNATLYRSLLEGLAPQVGFLHVPHANEAGGTGIASLARAVEAAVLVMAQQHTTPEAAATAPTALPTGGAPAGR